MKLYLEHNKRTYDELAEELEERMKRYVNTDREIISEFILKLNERFRKARVLELGPGCGLSIKYIAEEGFETTAIEISEKVIEIAKRTSPNTKYICGEFLETDFKGEKYEGIIAKAFIHLFPKEDAIKVLAKLWNLLTKGGVVFLSTTLHEDQKEGFFEKSDYNKKLKRYRKHWTKEELESAVLDSKFKIIWRKQDYEKEVDKTWYTLLLSKDE